MTDISLMPKGRSLRLGLDRDGLIKRLFVVIIALYLIAVLALPLYAMLSKSFLTYGVDLSRYEFQVSDESGTTWSPPISAAELNRSIGKFDAADLSVGSDGRIAVTELFPDFSFRSPVKYRIRGTVGNAPYLVGLDLKNTTDWAEFDGKSFRRISLRPVSTPGLQNYTAYFSNPTLVSSIKNSVFIASVATALTVTLAFGFAYALTRTCMPFKGAFRMVSMMPLLVPSLLPGIALIYLFGNQGILKTVLFGHSIYGPLGIVIGSVFFTFPHAALIISTALGMADQRHYESAETLRATKWRTFWTVTVPGARYGIVSAAFVTFTMVITDFGLPKVIGGQYNVLAIDIYKQVIGQQNFEMGAVVSVVLLIPAILAYLVDRHLQKASGALLSARSVPFAPKPNRRIDMLMLGWCTAIALFIAGTIAICQFAALVRYWPYDLSLTLGNYAFDLMDGGGWAAYGNSLKLAILTSVIGTILIVTGAYMVEKVDGFKTGRSMFQFLAMLPMAVPGMVLGLAYIFFFNNPANPLNFVYGTMAILVLSTVTHFYTVGHMTALTALKQIDPEFEAVATSLRRPFWTLFFRVTLPVCLPAILDISIYLFVNAMTTVSAVVFLYSTHTQLASVAVLNMDDAGDVAPAAAMGMMIFYTNVGARLLHAFASRRILTRTQAWRRR